MIPEINRDSNQCIGMFYRTSLPTRKSWLAILSDVTSNDIFQFPIETHWNGGKFIQNSPQSNTTAGA